MREDIVYSKDLKYNFQKYLFEKSYTDPVCINSVLSKQEKKLYLNFGDQINILFYRIQL